MTLRDWLTKLRDTLRKEEPADYEHYNAEHRREEREQTTLNLLKNEVGEGQADRQAERRYRKGMLWWSGLTFFVALFTMGAVIYYAAIARDQREAMREANGLNQKAIEVAQDASRPWVIASAFTTRFPGWAAGRKLAVTFQITNGGGTPAPETNVWYGARLMAKTPTSIPANIATKTQGPFVIFPHSEPVTILFDTDETLSEADVAGYTQGAVRLVIVTRIEYKDTFGRPHRVIQCHQWVSPANSSCGSDAD